MIVSPSLHHIPDIDLTPTGSRSRSSPLLHTTEQRALLQLFQPIFDPTEISEILQSVELLLNRSHP